MNRIIPSITQTWYDDMSDDDRENSDDMSDDKGE